MDKESLAKQSALSLLGLPETGPDLLDEVMKGRVQSPGNPMNKGFGAAKETAFEAFGKAAAIDMPTVGGSVQDAGAEPNANENVAAHEKQEEEKVEPNDLQEGGAEPEDETVDQPIPEY